MNVNAYTKEIAAQTSDNNILAAMFNSELEVKQPAIAREFDDFILYYRDHQKYDTIEEALADYNNELVYWAPPVWRDIQAGKKNLDWTPPMLNYLVCGKQLTIPVPPTDGPYSTCDKRANDKSSRQIAIECALRDPAIMDEYIKDMADTKVIGNGYYGTAFNVRKFHSMNNDGLIVKVFRYVNDSDMTIPYEVFACYIMNKLTMYSPNFMYTYGNAASISSCRHILADNEVGVEDVINKDICSDALNSHFIVQEYVKGATSLYDWMFNRKRSMAEILNVYMQFVGIFSYMANILRATHGDIHGNNVLIQQLKQPITMTYFFPNGSKFSVTSQHIVRLIDYGYISFVKPHDKVYVSNPGDRHLNTFSPARDIYLVTVMFGSYFKEIRPLMLKVIEVIYGRKEPLSAADEEYIMGDYGGRGKIVPNYGGYSDYDKASPRMFTDIIYTINDNVPEDMGYHLFDITDEDYYCIRRAYTMHQSYELDLYKQHQARDRKSAAEFLEMFNSDEYKTFAADPSTGNTAVFNKIVRPMMVLRAKSVSVRYPEYSSAVRSFEKTISVYYNMLKKGRVKSAIADYFEMVGMILPVKDTMM